MSAALALPPGLAWFAVATCLAAGAVRGFAGFGLSALAMATLAAFIPPVELIPVFWTLEMSASLVLMKGGWADADRTAALTLVLASSAALPVALLLSLSIPATVSKAIALALLVALALAQLARLRIPALASRAGTAMAGTGAGLITGLSGAGGLFLALYAMARELPPRRMRGTLNIYLLGAGVLGLATHLVLGTMDRQAALRGAILAVPTLAGVGLGVALFTPRFERYYRPFCLVLLLGLATAGLVRLTLETT